MTAAEQLSAWVAQQHSGQLIRRTDEPYFNHLLAVAEMAGPYAAYGYEIGLCHDLLEETAVTAARLQEVLPGFGYTAEAARLITSAVVELTDVFTSAAYPDLDKKARKKREQERLLTISAAAQTVKYADLAYNIRWMLTYDHQHAKKYLKKKRKLVTALVCGHPVLRQRLLDRIEQALEDRFAD